MLFVSVNKTDTWLIMAHKRFNMEKKVYCSLINDKFFHLDDFDKVDSRDNWETMFCLSQQLKRLGLTQEECCMMAAVNILLTGQWLPSGLVTPQF